MQEGHHGRFNHAVELAGYAISHQLSGEECSEGMGEPGSFPRDRYSIIGTAITAKGTHGPSREVWKKRNKWIQVKYQGSLSTEVRTV